MAAYYEENAPVPEWAAKKAAQLAEAEAPSMQGSWRIAFARYIAQHEQPPVDPLIEAVKSVLSGFENDGHAQTYATAIRDELAIRGFQIVEQSK